ncbi:UDP-glucuronosyltransferase [Aphelenchoides besseyi]|nr:UDP-glucuronosyltransferase [Aphelenchoides besseyi]KAI6222246.1 UDP-glucuronosyltransferase [Aphelenchoides besseyi]
MILRFLQFLPLLFWFTDGAKILFVSPNLANSMVLYTGRMADVLVKSGHEVTMLIPEIRASNQLNGTKLARVVRVRNLGDHFDKAMANYQDTFAPFRPSIWVRRAELIATAKICEALLRRFDELKWLRDEEFDLGIFDHVDFCDAGLIHALGIRKYIWTTTGPILDINAWAMGIPAETSYVVTPWEGFHSPRMNIFERALNLFQVYFDRLLYVERAYAVTQLFRRHIDSNFPNVVDVAKESSLLFVNADEFLEPARPTTSKVVYIGGVGLSNQSETISTELNEKISNITSDGFVYFSIGTSAPTRFISLPFKKAIIDAFQLFPSYQFVVKVDSEDHDFFELGSNSPNVHVISWAPQQSLLCHQKCSLFITHAGYNSMLESSRCGVPMLVVPIFFDQHRNSKVVEYREIGRILRPEQITTEKLRKELQILLNDKSYSQKARRFAKLHREKPNQPNQTLVDYVNFVLNNGPLRELQSELTNLNWLQTSHLDIFCCLSLFAVSIVSFLRKLRQHVRRKIKTS